MGRKQSSEMVVEKKKSKKDFKKKAQEVEQESKGGPARRTRSASKDHIEQIEDVSTKKKKYFKEGALVDGEKVEAEEVYPNQLEDFISDKETIKILRAKGIKYLFPIQEQSFQPILDGKDVVGKDRTGSGKTLAFGIPLIERLRQMKLITKGHKVKGQKPLALIILPTRELAIQVANEFKSLSHGNNEFRAHLAYGGTDIWEQINAIRDGCEILIGTPGRIMDLYNRGKLPFQDIQTVILDEADEMLNLGFVDDIKKIFEFIDADTGSRKTQNILFSATIPQWMNEISRKYQTPDRVFVDLMREDGCRTSKTVTHLAINCPYQQITETIGDVILVYGGGTKSRAIIFVETKREANEIMVKGKVKGELQVLHGDIPQKQREVTFKAYKEGKVQTLVCTNVAARGLDIPEIDLVIQCEPPKDVESYIHRSGRTARAGRSGVCITFYNKKHFGMIERIEKKAQIKIARVGAPQPEQIMAASARDIASSLKQVDQDALNLFKGVAHELVEEIGAEDALARALATIAGVTKKIKGRSLLCSMVGFKTYICKTTEDFRALGYIWSFLRNNFDEALVNSVKGLKKIEGQQAAIFDIPEEQEHQFIKYNKDKADGNIKWGHDLEVATEIPDVNEQRSNGSTGAYTSGGIRERMEAKKQKKDLEIFIGGLPFEVNETKLADFFRQKGVDFWELRLLYGDDNRCKGLGFGLCKNREHVQKALRVDGQQYGGRRLRVNMSDKKPNGGGGRY